MPTEKSREFRDNPRIRPIYASKQEKRGLNVSMVEARTLLRYLATTGLFVLVLCLTALPGVADPGQASDDDFENGEVVVKLDQAYLDPITGSPVTVDDINASYDSTILQKLLGSAGIYLLKLPADSDTEGMADQMQADPRLLYAEPNFVAESPEGGARHRARRAKESVLYGQYAYEALNLSCAHRISKGGGATVAVLDTGAQLRHPALKDNFAGTAKYDFVDDNTNVSDHPVGLDSDGNGLKDELVGHGTHVAGIVNLVAPSSDIMPLRVLDSEGYGNVFIIAEAISFARQNGADVINLSLSTTAQSDLLADVIEDATDEGTVVVAAAGNDNTDLAHYPAAGDGVLAVTSVDKNEKKSGFASYGAWVDVAAPGSGIRSTFPVNRYMPWSGTSMAAPFVAGQAALIRNADGSLDPEAVEALIQETARPLDETNPLHAGMLGAGHSNVGASLGELRPGTCS